MSSPQSFLALRAPYSALQQPLRAKGGGAIDGGTAPASAAITAPTGGPMYMITSVACPMAPRQ